MERLSGETELLSRLPMVGRNDRICVSSWIYMTPEEEFKEAMEDWKKAVDNIIDTTVQTRKVLELATDRLKIFLSDFQDYQKNSIVRKSRSENKFNAKN